MEISDFEYYQFLKVQKRQLSIIFKGLSCFTELPFLQRFVSCFNKFVKVFETN